MAKVITLKMANGEHLNITPAQEINVTDVFNEFLGGRKEFVEVGTVAISKQHIVYMSISDLDPPQEVADGEKGSAEGNTPSVCAVGESGGGGCGELNADILIPIDGEGNTECCKEGNCASV